MKEFIASLVDASLPEEQQSFLLTSADGHMLGGDNTKGTCVNDHSEGCTGTNEKCTNYGPECVDGDNTYLCLNTEHTGFDTDSDFTCTGPIKP